MRVLVVDDEPMARRVLLRFLHSDSSVTSVSECETGESARAKLAEGNVDVVFMDVQMPGIDGFEALDEAVRGGLPVVVFVTAHEQYALAAIDVGVADYLLKPFDEPRFARAFNRAKERFRQVSVLRRGDELVELLSDAQKGEVLHGRADRISVHDGTRFRRIDPGEICWVEADDKYVLIHMVDEVVIRARRTLVDIERELDSRAFLRVHRSCLVSVRGITGLDQTVGGAAYLTMTDGSRVAVSRSRLQAVRSRLR